MNMKKGKLIILLIILVGALLAAAIMKKFTPNQSWVAFGGWVIFFIAIQVPWLLVSSEKYNVCTAWFSGLKKKLSSN